MPVNLLLGREINNGFNGKEENAMDKSKVMKVAGVLLPILGASINLASNWFDNKKLDETITEKVAEAVSKSKES